MPRVSVWMECVTTDLVNRADLETLASPDGDPPFVSLLAPTHRFGADVEVDRLAWKNVVSGAEDALAERAMRRPEITDLLAPARALQHDGLAWQHMGDGLAMYLRPGWHRTLRVPIALPELVSVGDRFLLGPLLPMVSGDEHFLVLALSQRSLRLFEGSRQRIAQVELAGVPTDLRDVVAPPEPRSDTMARPATSGGGTSGRAVFYGHGAADEDYRKDDLVSFLREVADGLHRVLAGKTAPLVLVGLEDLVATYREVNGYRNLVGTAITSNADEMSADDLHRSAWSVVERRVDAARDQAVSVFRQLQGTQRVSGDPEVVRQAAHEGRVETLFMTADPWCWRQDETGQLRVVEMGRAGPFAECERLDATAVDTLRTGGRVHATPSQVVAGSDVAAVFRY